MGLFASLWICLEDPKTWFPAAMVRVNSAEPDRAYGTSSRITLSETVRENPPLLYPVRLCVQKTSSSDCRV